MTNNEFEAAKMEEQMSSTIGKREYKLISLVVDNKEAFEDVISKFKTSLRLIKFTKSAFPETSSLCYAEIEIEESSEFNLFFLGRLYESKKYYLENAESKIKS